VSARSTGLALELDDGTRKSHSVAENTGEPRCLRALIA
jgi:hypothetical protein